MKDGKETPQCETETDIMMWSVVHKSTISGDLCRIFVLYLFEFDVMWSDWLTPNVVKCWVFWTHILLFHVKVCV